MVYGAMQVWARTIRIPMKVQGQLQEDLALRPTTGTITPVLMKTGAMKAALMTTAAIQPQVEVLILRRLPAPAVLLEAAAVAEVAAAVAAEDFSP